MWESVTFPQKKGVDFLDRKKIKSTQIYQEMEPNKAKSWFHFKRSKFIYGVDTLYCVLYPDCPWPESEQAKRLLDYLDVKKREMEETLEPVPLEQTDLSMKYGFSFGFYTYHVGINDAWDMFICKKKPNEDTPALFLQFRSQYLWTEGVKKALYKTIERIEQFLLPFEIKIKDVQENRIDYAFHTNYIQDPVNFFPLKYLREMQVSNFSRWHVEGHFYDEITHQDYLTLGRRTSNNVFIRCYNKSKEVVEMAYKQFFIWIWLLHGLISKYDAYVLEYAYIKKRWHAKEEARLMFYLDHGSDHRIKSEINLLLNEKTPYQELKALADQLLPDLTIITNFEFQTKRKFYANIDFPIVTECKDHLKRIENIYQLQPEIKNMLTNEVIRFVKYKGKNKQVRRKDRQTADWWKRLQATKVQDLLRESEYKLIRTYQRNLDMERQKTLTMHKMATTSIYLNGMEDTTGIEMNLIQFLSTINDNDLHAYQTYKKKKALELKRQFEGHQKTNHSPRYALVNKINGETIE